MSRNSMFFNFGMAVIATVAVLYVFSNDAFAQSTAALQGTITDASGAVVPGAKIVVRNLGTAEQRTAESDSAGEYVVPSLPVGTYRVDVTARGMQSVAVNNLPLEVGQSAAQNGIRGVARSRSGSDRRRL